MNVSICSIGWLYLKADALIEEMMNERMPIKYEKSYWKSQDKVGSFKWICTAPNE
jgi:hypothetical protein